MRYILTRRVSAAALTAVILFAAVFGMSVFANAATTFTPRTSEPSSQNAYYYSDKNIYYKYGYGMPNCTAYAYGRAYEILKSEPKLCPYSAEQWYDYNKSNKYYSYGKTPKLGAIACWSYSGGGHVAVVEKIESGKLTLSNSEWGGRTFYLTTPSTSDANYGGNSWWTFQGFIYIGDFETSKTDPTTSAYTTGIYKTNVTTTLNMRSGAGTSNAYVTSIPNAVKLTVTQIKPNDGYTWGYTSYNGKNGWVALDFCDYVSPLPTNPPTTVPETTQPTTVPPTTQPTTALPATTQPTTAPQTTQPTTERPTEAATTKPQGLGVGDVNYDGSIDIKDATEIQKYAVDLVTFTDEQMKFADFDFDGKVDIGDVTCMQKFFAQ